MKLMMTALMLLTLNAFAGEVKVYETTDNVYTGQILGDYGINEDMGRAWVELEIQSTLPDTDSTYEKVKVPGLTLQGDSLMLEIDGQQVECAHVRAVGIFHYRVARATKSCRFETRYSKTTVDDGYETRRVTMASVYLVTR